MSEHAWTSELIAALAAGGLDAAETERAEAHIRECAECQSALRDARALDRGMSALFAPIQPAGTLEDRMIQSLHNPKKPVYVSRSRARGWQRKLALGVAASIGLGITGAGLSVLAGEGGLPMPGGMRLESTQDGLRMSAITLSQDFAGEPTIEAALIDNSASPRDVGKALERRIRTSGRDPETMASELTGRLHGWERGEAKSFAKNELGIVLDPKLPTNYSVTGLEDTTTPTRVPPTDNGRRKETNEWYKLSRGVTPKSPATGYGEKSERPTSGLGLPYYKPGENKPTSEFGPPILSNIPHTNRITKSTEPGNKEDPNVFTPKLVTGQYQPNTPPPPPEAAIQRKIIRSGDIEFEVEAFDAASATVIKLIEPIKGGFVATINSEKLPNGKVKGSIVVRVPPDKLDAFIADLRRELGKAGELKGQRIGSQEITKQYFDLESRLRAARTMEQRLLQIIKDGKGEIKQLLEAEKLLGETRTEIEKMEGEKRYFDNQVALSTLTITLAEKEIRAAAGLTESERVQTGIEVEDVEQAHRDALAAVANAKGRVTKSEVKQLAAGQFNATLNFEVAPEQAGPVRDRLKQLGRTARLEVDRVQQAEGGGTPQRDAKVKRGDTIFIVQFYNLANIAPRESVTMQLAAPDVPAAYRGLVDAVTRAKGRIITSKLDENDRQNVSAQLDFEVRRAEEAAVQTALAAAGETISRNVNRAADTENVTDSKILYRMTLVSAGRLQPREIVTLGIVVDNVDAAIAAASAQVSDAKGRVTDTRISRQASGKVSAELTIMAPLSASAGLTERFKTFGIVRSEDRSRNPHAPEGQYATALFTIVFANRDPIVAENEGLGSKVRKGLSTSLSFLLSSLSWLIFGLCVVLPWAVVGYGVYRVGRWLFRGTPAAAAPAPPAA